MTTAVERADQIQRVRETMMIPEIWSSPVISEGKGAIVRDTEGKEYIDCQAGPGVLSIGHSHPDFVAAMCAQIQRLAISPKKCMHLPLLELANEFSEIIPRPLSRFYLSNSGAEAVEIAVKLTKKHSTISGKTGSQMISLQHGFHGLTGVALTLTGQRSWKKGLGNFANYPSVHHIRAPYCYRCRHSYPECGTECASELERITECVGEGNISGFIYEPILGGGGNIVPPAKYHEEVRRICTKYGITLIFDEIFTGMGRTGTMFAYQNWNTEPDIMILGKGLGGGFPIGAVVATEKIALSFQKGDHGGTFSANPLTCAAAAASIKVIRKLALHNQALRIGSIMMDQFLEMKESGLLKGDVRGLGLCIGLELVEDEERKTPSSSLATRLERRLTEKGVLVGTGGPHRNVIRINPPLTISEDEARKATDVIRECLTLEREQTVP